MVQYLAERTISSLDSSPVVMNSSHPPCDKLHSSAEASESDSLLLWGRDNTGRKPLFKLDILKQS